MTNDMKPCVECAGYESCYNRSRASIDKFAIDRLVVFVVYGHDCFVEDEIEEE